MVEVREPSCRRLGVAALLRSESFLDLFEQVERDVTDSVELSVLIHDRGYSRFVQNFQFRV
jgi:hypothetical protein